MSEWLVLLLASFGTFRVTRLVVEDSITDIPRTWLMLRLPPFGVEMIRCYWCVGFWVSGVASFTVWALGYLPLRAVGLAWPAIAGAAGLLRSRSS